LNERPPLPQPDRDRPLHEVIEEFGERLRPGGSYGEIDEWSVYDESFRRLRAWAEENGCYQPHLSPLREGGREHDLTFPGMVTEIAVSPGTEVKAGDKLVVIEAMKMLTTVSAPVDGIVKEIIVKKGIQIDSDDLLVILE
jgi:hypothetical protein